MPVNEKGQTAGNRQSPQNQIALTGISIPDIQELKQAATPYLPELLERVGFRPSRIKHKYQCCDHEDKTPSVHLYSWGAKRYCCGDSLDAVELAKRASDGTFKGGIRELEYLTGFHLGAGRPQTPAMSEATLARVDLFRVGYVWWLEEHLAALKLAWLADEDAPEGEQIRPVTARLADVRQWTPYDAARFLRTFEPERLAFVRERISEARELQDRLADAIRGERTVVAA